MWASGKLYKPLKIWHRENKGELQDIMLPWGTGLAPDCTVLGGREKFELTSLIKVKKHEECLTEVDQKRWVPWEGPEVEKHVKAKIMKCLEVMSDEQNMKKQTC